MRAQVDDVTLAFVLQVVARCCDLLRPVRRVAHVGSGNKLDDLFCRLVVDLQPPACVFGALKLVGLAQQAYRITTIARLELQLESIWRAHPLSLAARKLASCVHLATWPHEAKLTSQAKPSQAGQSKAKLSDVRLFLAVAVSRLHSRPGL